MLDAMYALGAAAGKMAKPTKQKKQGAPARAAAAQKQLRTGKAAAGKAAPAPTRQGAPARAAAAVRSRRSVTADASNSARQKQSRATESQYQYDMNAWKQSKRAMS